MSRLEKLRDFKVLILVRSHKDFILDEATQKSTWAKNCENFEIYWLHGDSMSQSLDTRSSRVHQPFPDTRINMLKKVVSSIQLLESHNPDLIILTTTNTYWNKTKIFHWFECMQSNQMYFAGHVETWSFKDATSDEKLQNIKKGDSFINGATMLLRPEAYRSLLQISLEKYLQIPDDVAISDFLKGCGFRFQNFNRNNMYQSHIFLPNATSRVKGVLTKSHTRDRMNDIHRYYMARNFRQKVISFLYIHYRELRRISTKKLMHPVSFLLRNFG